MQGDKKGKGKANAATAMDAAAAPRAKPKTAAQLKLQEMADAAAGPPMPPVVDGPTGTLIVCPLSVLSNWQTQIQEHTAGNLKVWLVTPLEISSSLT